MRPRSRSPLRILAPVALVAFVIAFIVVLNSSKVSHDSGSGGSASTTTTNTTPSSRNKYAHRRTYTVRTGDTLGAISIKTGVSVTDLEDLNPGLDPQGLVAGQKIKLRQ